jgi:superfamily II DNA or RNA helicase
MTLKNLKVRAVYGGDERQLALQEFLIPALQSATSYDRVSGYFSSTSIGLAAKGISGLLSNGGKMRLVTSHILTQRDFEALSSGFSDLPDLTEATLQDFSSTLASHETLEDKMKSDYVAAMCWLIAEGKLEIRIVVPDKPEANGLTKADLEKFHPKFGIITDGEGSQFVFSGSVNETQLGWAGNIENLSIYKSWSPDLHEYCQIYSKSFEEYWNGVNLNGWRTVSLPEALRVGLVQMAPMGEFPDIAEWEEKDPDKVVKSRSPRQYQVAAVEAWTNAGRVGILEMATGTGKTFTSKLCVESAMEEGKLMTVVVAPYQHISDQWVEELGKFDPIQIGATGSWRSELQSIEFNCKLGLIDNLVIVVVKNTAASQDFISATNSLSTFFDNYLFVGDEVHWLGAPSLQKALNPEANFRLGLSATPDRHFDEEGTSALRQYFGEESVYTFDLKSALEWTNDDGTVGVLAPYYYYPVFVELTPEEDDKYSKMTRMLGILQAKKVKTAKDYQDIESLRIRRADIAKSAAQKLPALENLLIKLGADLKQCLIYCATFNQMDEAMSIARKTGIDTSSRITGLETASKSEYFKGRSQREHILSSFAAGRHGVLFAIDCLDEGVDVPSAETGIILASSGNPKEFIQRRGRLMRRSPETGKDSAKIYDMVVLQAKDNTPENLRRIELRRVEEFAELAINRDEIQSVIQEYL